MLDIAWSHHGIHRIRSRGQQLRGVSSQAALFGAVVRDDGEALIVDSPCRRLSVVVQNGRVQKSGYEEGYFRNGGGGGASSVFRLPSVRRSDDGNDIAAALLAELGISAKREQEPAGGGEVAATIESNWVE